MSTKDWFEWKGRGMGRKGEEGGREGVKKKKEERGRWQVWARGRYKRSKVAAVATLGSTFANEMDATYLLKELPFSRQASISAMETDSLAEVARSSSGTASSGTASSSAGVCSTSTAAPKSPSK